MKKSLPIIIALVVIVVALTGWKFLSQNKETSTKDENGQTPTTQEEIQENIMVRLLLMASLAILF